jgi:hypothetical protein
MSGFLLLKQREASKAARSEVGDEPEARCVEPRGEESAHD